MAFTTNQEAVAEFYIAALGRSPEKAGLDYWVGRLDGTTGAQLTLDQVRAFFVDSSIPEVATRFPAGQTNQAMVESIYQNVLSRAGDADGVAYWVSRIEGTNTDGQPKITDLSEIITHVLGAATAANDAATLANKTTFAEHVYASTATLTAAELSTDSITDDTATLDAATAAVDALEPQTFSLTTATTDNIVGTANNDTITAVNSSALSEGTLQVSDKIDGGAGTDVANISMKQNFTGFTTGSMTGVETVNLTNNSSAALSFTATGVTGVTKYAITNNVAGVNNTLADLATLADVEVSGTTGTSTLSVGYKATSTVATGTQTDVQNLKVTNVGTIDTSTTGTTNAKYMTVDADKVETLAITTAGTSNSLDLSGSADTKTITVTGEGQTEIAAIDDSVTSFDASGATGKVIATLTGATTNTVTAVKSGSGDDTLTVALDDLTSSATISGGTGADTLSIASSGAKTIQATMTGIETLKVAAPAAITGAVVFSGTNVTGLTTLDVAAGALGANFSLANMGANAINVKANAATGNTVSADNSGAVTLDYTKLASATTAATSTTAMTFANASSLTVNVNEKMVGNGTITTGTTGAVTLNVASSVVNSAETTSFNNLIEADSASSITVNATGELIGAGISADSATSATITTGSTATGNDIEIQGAKITTLTITANGNLDMDGNNATTATTLTKLQTLNATTAGLLDFTGVAMADAANITLAGTNTNSAVTLNNLGATTLTHDVSLTATGLKAGLTTGTIDAGTAAASVNVSGVTGNVTLGTIDGDNGITITATNLGGNLANGVAALATTSGNISIDVSNASGTTTLGTLTTTTGNVSLLATSSVGAVNVQKITGNNVTINGQNALGLVSVNGVTTASNDGTEEIIAKTSVTYTGNNLFANGFDLETAADSTAFTATLNGGAAAEVITLDSKSAVQTSITVTGNLGAGANMVKVILADNTGSAAADAQTVNLSGLTSGATAGNATVPNATPTATANHETYTDLSLEVDSAITYTGSVKDDFIVYGAAASTNSNAIAISDSTATDSDILFFDTGAAAAVTLTNVSLSGIEKLVVDDTSAVTINASAISDKAIAVSGYAANDILILTGTTGADVVDLSKVTDGGNDAVFALKGSAGADVFVGSLFADHYAIADAQVDSTSAAMDSISSFAVAADKINLATAASGATASGSIAFVVASDVAAAAGTTNGIATGMFTFDAAAATSLTDAIAKVGADVTTAGNSVIFEYDGNTYFFADTDNAATTTSDLIIKLTGVDSASMSAAAEVFTIA